MTDAPAEKPKSPSILWGAGAGFLASFLGFIATYIYMCGWTGATTGGDIGVIVLSALTVIPLMMILVFFLPNVLLGILIGLALGVIARLRGSAPRLPLGVLLGVVGSHLVFRDLFPVVFTHASNDKDISVLLSSLPYVVIYGALLGAVVSKLYGKRG